MVNKAIFRGYMTIVEANLAGWKLIYDCIWLACFQPTKKEQFRCFNRKMRVCLEKENPFWIPSIFRLNVGLQACRYCTLANGAPLGTVIEK